MPENQVEDDDDEGFGDFKFVSPSDQPLSFSQNTRVDDNWGDFMDNFSQKQDSVGTSLGFEPYNGFHTQNPTGFLQTEKSFDPFGFLSGHSTKVPEADSNLGEDGKHSASPVSDKRWEKPRGALPLSFFGEEDRESDSVDSSTNAAMDMFSPKPAAPVNIGSSIALTDLLVNLYSQADQIRTENGSTSNLVDENSDFDDEGWEFKDAFSENKVGDNNSSVQAEKTHDLFEVQVETTKINSQFQVNGERLENPEESIHVSGFSNGQELCEFFVKEDGFSHNKSADFDDGLGFETSFFIQNGSILVSNTQSKQIIAENGSNSHSVNGDINSVDNYWDFKDAFSENGAVNGSSEKKEEQQGAGHSGAGVEVLIFDSETQVDKKEEQQSAVHSGAGVEVLIFDSETQVDKKGNGGQSRHQEVWPLSFFSNDNLDSDDAMYVQNASSYKPKIYAGNSTNSHGSSPHLSFNDLISSLYSQVEHPSTVDTTKEPLENGFNSAQMGMNSQLVNGQGDGMISQLLNVQDDDMNSHLVNEQDDFNKNSCKFKDAFSETRAGDQNYRITDTDEKITMGSKLRNFVDIYTRLKDQTCAVALHHLDGLKNAQKVAALSGEDGKAVELLEEIQVAYKKLHMENVVPEGAFLEEHALRNIRVDEFMQEQEFQVLDREYHLLRRISLAEKDLSSAIELFEHTFFVLKMLTLGSMEEQSNYVTTLSKMISVCAEELKHSAFIWKQSMQKNAHKKILSEPRGQRYVLALGEIYRVVEVLRVSATTVHKPWILSSLVSPSDIFTPLEECIALWSNSGLEEALQSLSNTTKCGCEETALTLLESIKSVRDLDELSLQNHLLAQWESVCQLSGLSLAMVPGMKLVEWNGGNYFLTLANLWVNRVACDLPKLPYMVVSH
ncbi:PREDICTED: uncharacterized protein LOC104596459 isoform X2 [Nelumbo nucifera]|uniref:Uncharacterized protein LOC104596459 isoform X2 n=1 Tax=Nelumbo nucifera TaxID=4432 RepID=A0A1U7ZUU3_NELNU|nr:PREDICTED: uncharacterized protein LOC104596459 isoform X2 [Nelumbo nucifera]